MATTDTPDALLLLRASVASNNPPTLTPTDSLDTASELLFPALPPLTSAPVAIPLSTLTRFIKDNAAVDLRSIYFAWQERETTITEYIASAQALGVTHLGFIERLELVTFVEGGQEESDHIRPLPSQPPSSQLKLVSSAAAPAPSAAAPAQRQPTPQLVGKVRTTDPRLLEIYAGERVVVNRNVMLRGIKPTVSFSHTWVQGGEEGRGVDEDRISPMLENRPRISSAASAPAPNPRRPPEQPCLRVPRRLTAPLPRSRSRKRSREDRTPSSYSRRRPPRC
jgi:parafibromin